MSVEMTNAPEMNADGVPPPEEPPHQENAPAKRTWVCSRCGATIDWLPEKVRHLHPSKICCLSCQKAKKASEAPADAPAPPPAPVREAPRHAAPQQRRPAGGSQHRRAQAPRELTLEIVELCAFRSGIAPPQVEALLLAIRSHMTPSSSSDK